MNSTTINLEDLPNDPFELCGKLFSFGIEERIECSLDYIQKECKRKNRLYLCREFMYEIYFYCFKGTINEIHKHGRFPSAETTYQFDYAIKHALSGSYGAAFNHLRTCLELTVLSIHFSMEPHIFHGEGLSKFTAEEIANELKSERKWIESLANTPLFSKMVKAIRENPRFKAFDSSFNWIETLESNYHALSDYTHIKGFNKGTAKMTDIRTYFSSSYFHSVNLTTLAEFIELMIRTIENIAVLIALYNPITLVELLSLEEKLEINEPIGLIYPYQSGKLSQLIPERYHSFFEGLITEDEEVKSIVDWVASRPSMIEES